jgi:hypothetical protein
MELILLKTFYHFFLILTGSREDYETAHFTLGKYFIPNFILHPKSTVVFQNHLMLGYIKIQKSLNRSG